MIITSGNIAKLAEALAAAQGEIEGAKKGSVNPHFKSRYADLDSTWNACRQQLSKHGLSVVQFPFDTQDGKIGITTRLMHTSGEWAQGAIAVKMSQETNPQNAGSILTYLRRYSLQGVVGISPEDDDGNAAAAGSGQSYRVEPAEDLDDKVVASLNLAKGLEELAKAWGEIPVGQRRLYSRVKDEAKERIAKNENP